MALQIRATATNNSGTGSNNQASVTIPADVQAGDYLLELVVIIANGATQTPPAGWTTLGALTAGNSSSSLRGAYRRAQGGDASSVVTFGLSNSTRWAVVLLAIYDDAGDTARVEQMTVSGFSANTTAPTTPAVDPLHTDDILLAVFGGGPQVNGTQVTLTPNGSFTPQAQATSLSVTLKNATLAVASQILPNADPIDLVTHTASAAIAPVGASILISPHNTGPVANAGNDQNVGPGALVTLDGSASNDPDGGTISYTWQQLSGPAVSLSDDTATQPTFTAPAPVTPTALVFCLTVTDDEGATSSQDTVTINVAISSSIDVWNGTAMEKRLLRHWVGGNWVG